MPINEPTIAALVSTDPLPVPPWVTGLVGGKALSGVDAARSTVSLEVVEGEGWTLVSAVVHGAAGLGQSEFQSATTEVYIRLRSTLDRCNATHPVRMWNYIPAIHRQYPDRRDQYMTFNAGRYAAFSNWYGDVRWAERSVPTASAVGHDGEDFVVHCLASSRPGVPVENPRQVSAYHYSQRYGPKPPCFARATVIEPDKGVRRVLIGGTASVVGEDSRHDQLASQARETFVNLAQLIRAAGIHGGLSHLTDARVYYVRPDDRPTLERLVRDSFPAKSRIEWSRADLCRPELLVEIEGVAG